ncbi:MAG TPA: AAA family ATPase [Candidatus Elarobacter sp.]|nr:AAA family ATPase [Candidatus Elarobacter sp.]
MPAAPEFPLIGRDDDLALLVAARREATANGPRFLLILGDAGTGKTRLVDELVARVAETEVVVGRANEFAVAPYAAFSEVVRQLDAREPTVLGKRPALRRALETLAARAAPSAERAGDKHATFDAVVEAVRFYSARRVFTLVLEDAHWSDLATLELVYHLALVASGTPVLFVVTARESGLDEPRVKMLERLARLPSVARLRLNVLEPDAAAALVDEELRRGRRSLGAVERRAILAAADGNPLYLRELTRHHASRGTSGDALPGSLTASVRARLRELPNGVQRVVRAASALVEFDEELLAGVAGVSLDETAAALRVALDHGFVVPPADAWRGLTFRHELIRRTVYEDALPAERRRLHRAMVAHLDAEPHADPDFSRRALHAFSGGDRTAAAHWNERAGDAASAHSAFADAAEFYHRAVDAGASTLLDKEAHALERAGRPVAALPLLRRRLDEIGAAADATTRAGILLRIARAEVRAARRDASLDAIERARVLLAGAAPSPEHYGVHVFRAWLAASVLDAPATLDALAEAEPYRAFGDDQSVMRAYEAAAIAYGAQRDLVRWRASYEGMIATAEASGDVLRAIGGFANFAVSAFGHDTELAVALNERAVELAERTRRVELVPYVFATAAWTALAVGDLARARQLVERALPYCGDFPASEVIASSVGVVVAIRTDDEALLERCFREQLFDDALRSGAAWQILTVVPALTERFAALGRPDRARSVIARVVPRLASLSGLPEIAVKIAEFGLDRELPSLSRWLEDEAAERPNTIGFLHLYRSVVARGGVDRERHARFASDAFRSVGYRLWEATALERAGDAPAARAAYEACGAVRDVNRLSDGPRSAAAPNRLTKRESQIADLAATGLSNREIAEQLSLSDRTVEHHLGAVFAKLGVRSRVELAARKSRQPT